MAIQYDKTPLVGKISDYSERLRLVKVDETKFEVYWDEIVKEYHYLGFNQTMGARVKYIVMLGRRPVGAISFVSATPRLNTTMKHKYFFQGLTQSYQSLCANICDGSRS